MKSIIKATSISLKKNWYLIASFFLPMLVMIIVYINFGMYPIGKDSILVLDMNAQYIDYFAALRNIFSRDTSLLYSWSRNLGGEMLGLTSYYLASPFSLLIFLFPKANLVEAVMFISLIKVASSGLTFAIFLKHSRLLNTHAKHECMHKLADADLSETKANVALTEAQAVFNIISTKTPDSKYSGMTVIMFSTLYALCAYMVVQLMNLMWIDALVFLPLIILGLERLIDTNKYLLFMFTLTIMFISNFYVAYMVGIFTFLYFIYYSFCRYSFKQIKIVLKKFAVFVGCALLAGGGSLFLILPTYFSMKMGKFDFDKTDYIPRAINLLFDIIPKMLPGAYDTVENEGLPFINTGALSLLLLPVYFISSQISSKKRILSAFFLGIIYISFNVHTLFVVWHVFNVPNWLPHRFSFLFSFLVLIFSYEAFLNIKNIANKTLLKVYVAWAFLVIFIEKQKYSYITSEGVIWFSLICLTIYIIFLCMNKQVKRRTLFMALLISLMCVELFFNSTLLMVGLNNDVVYSSRNSYAEFIEQTQPVVDNVLQQDSSLYRMEKTFKRSKNDPLSLGFSGVSHTSSTLNISILNFLSNIGLSKRGHWACYAGSTLVTDSILGIKYILTKSEFDHNYYNKKDFTQNDIMVYENPYALPFGFMVNSKLEELSLGSSNPFYAQNQILSVMQNIPYTEYFKSVTLVDERLTNITTSNTAKSGYTQYKPDNSKRDALVEFVVEAVGDNVMYANFPTSFYNDVEARVNNKLLYNFFDDYNFTIMTLGSYSDKQNISIEFKLLEDELYIKDKRFFYLDIELFESAIQELKSNSLQVTEHSERFIRGLVTADKNKSLLYTSIPYEFGWSVYIDGKKAEPVKTINALLAVHVPEGTHEITLKFIPKGFVLGCSISLASFVVMIVLFVVRRRSVQ